MTEQFEMFEPGEMESDNASVKPAEIVQSRENCVPVNSLKNLKAWLRKAVRQGTPSDLMRALKPGCCVGRPAPARADTPLSASSKIERKQ